MSYTRQMKIRDRGSPRLCPTRLAAVHRPWCDQISDISNLKGRLTLGRAFSGSVAMPVASRRRKGVWREAVHRMIAGKGQELCVCGGGHLSKAFLQQHDS